MVFSTSILSKNMFFLSLETRKYLPGSSQSPFLQQAQNASHTQLGAMPSRQSTPQVLTRSITAQKGE